MVRRKTFSDSPVTYAAVGCTQAGDVMTYPPTGFRSTFDECRLGSGAARFEAAAASLVTWGMPLGAQVRILQITEADATGYQSLLFTEFGTPQRPELAPVEAVYSAEGTQAVSAGQSVEVNGVFRPFSSTSAFRVIYVIQEDRRAGYGWGTLDETPVVGEEYFGVEWREDDSVFAIVRTVTQIGRRRWCRILSPLIRLRQGIVRRRYVRALLPARSV